MPLYEYHCEPCDHTFETLVRSATDAPRCPECGGIDLTNQFSVPAAAHTGAAGASLPICNSGAQNFGCGAGQCRTGMCSLD